MSAVLALVVFVGVSGPASGKIDRQVGALLHLEAGVGRVDVSAHQLAVLGVPTRGPRMMRKLEHKRSLRGKAVVAGKVIRKRHSAHLRMVLYSKRGTMTDLLEVPIRGDKLDRKAIANLREVLIPAVQDLDPNSTANDDEAAIEMDGDGDSPFAKSSGDDDGDSPFAKSSGDDSADSASSDDATSDSTDRDSSSDTDRGWDDSSIGPTAPTLGMRASIGLGFVARSFAPAPEAIPAYSSTAVGSIRFSGSVQPTKTLTVHLAAERTLGMTTQVGNETAATSIGRWQGTGSYTLHDGKVKLAAVGGLGRRSFVIESKAPMRSPDGEYTYLVTGAQAQTSIGKRVFLGALMAIEPVIGGAQPTRDAYGPARRWALEMSGALGVVVRDHVFVEARAEYQRFSWSWGNAGSRGAGGASDGYPGATLSVGAQY